MAVNRSFELTKEQGQGRRRRITSSRTARRTSAKR
jgi:hypothetical protein